MKRRLSEIETSSAEKNDLTPQCAMVLACCSIGCLLVATASAQPTSRLTLRSSSPLLEDSFAWAKDKTLSCVRTGQRPGYVPCYFTAMSDREFCVRDVAHMMEGAHLLGLDRENWSMMSLFAWGANRRVKQDAHWPRWHYPYTGRDTEDFGSCQWRTLPAPFDMAWRCHEQYLWTGDQRWIDDPELFTFHTNLHTKFMENQNWDHDPVADELMQLASYFEFPRSGEDFIEAGDAIGCQYQALLAYSAILECRGDLAAAVVYRDKATRLRAHFETCWFDKTAGRYIRGFDRFTDFRSDWGRENSFFMPMTLITDQGPRTAAYLDFIDYDIYSGTVNVGSTTSTDFQVAGLDANTGYTFTVRAWDADGNTSAASASVNATTPLAPDRAYLSELNWRSATTGFGAIGKDRSIDGKPIRVNGAAYERGIGTHASSEIVYDLSKLGRSYARFISDVGVDDGISAMGTVVFQVYADGEKVFDSSVMTPTSATKSVDVGVAGVNELKLVVTDARDGINSDHADWAGARLVTESAVGR